MRLLYQGHYFEQATIHPMVDEPHLGFTHPSNCNCRRSLDDYGEAMRELMRVEDLWLRAPNAGLGLLEFAERMGFGRVEK